MVISDKAVIFLLEKYFRQEHIDSLLERTPKKALAELSAKATDAEYYELMDLIQNPTQDSDKMRIYASAGLDLPIILYVGQEFTLETLAQLYKQCANHIPIEEFQSLIESVSESNLGNLEELMEVFVTCVALTGQEGTS